jgi:hypothetical protein
MYQIVFVQDRTMKTLIDSEAIENFMSKKVAVVNEINLAAMKQTYEIQRIDDQEQRVTQQTEFVEVCIKIKT